MNKVMAVPCEKLGAAVFLQSLSACKGALDVGAPIGVAAVSFSQILSTYSGALEASAPYCDKDVILVVGASGVGKTTTIAALNQNIVEKYKVRFPEEYEQKVLTLDEVEDIEAKGISYDITGVVYDTVDTGEGSPVIGHRAKSCTKYVNGYKAKGLGLDTYYVDSGGFFDNRGVATDIGNALAIYLVLMRAKSVRILICSNFSTDISAPRPTEFLALVKQFCSHLLPIFEHPKVSNSILLVATHATKVVKKYDRKLKRTTEYKAPVEDNEVVDIINKIARELPDLSDKPITFFTREEGRFIKTIQLGASSSNQDLSVKDLFEVVKELDAFTPAKIDSFRIPFSADSYLALEKYLEQMCWADYLVQSDQLKQQIAKRRQEIMELQKRVEVNRRCGFECQQKIDRLTGDLMKQIDEANIELEIQKLEFKIVKFREELHKPLPSFESTVQENDEASLCYGVFLKAYQSKQTELKRNISATLSDAEKKLRYIKSKKDLIDTTKREKSWIDSKLCDFQERLENEQENIVDLERQDLESNLYIQEHILPYFLIINKIPKFELGLTEGSSICRFLQLCKEMGLIDKEKQKIIPATENVYTNFSSMLSGGFGYRKQSLLMSTLEYGMALTQTGQLPTQSFIICLLQYVTQIFSFEGHLKELSEEPSRLEELYFSIIEKMPDLTLTEDNLSQIDRIVYTIQDETGCIIPLIYLFDSQVSTLENIYQPCQANEQPIVIVRIKASNEFNLEDKFIYQLLVNDCYGFKSRDMFANTVKKQVKHSDELSYLANQVMSGVDVSLIFEYLESRLAAVFSVTSFQGIADFFSELFEREPDNFPKLLSLIQLEKELTIAGRNKILGDLKKYIGDQFCLAVKRVIQQKIDEEREKYKATEKDLNSLELQKRSNEMSRFDLRLRLECFGKTEKQRYLKEMEQFVAVLNHYIANSKHDLHAQFSHGSEPTILIHQWLQQITNEATRIKLKDISTKRPELVPIYLELIRQQCDLMKQPAVFSFDSTSLCCKAESSHLLFVSGCLGKLQEFREKEEKILNAEIDLFVKAPILVLDVPSIDWSGGHVVLVADQLWIPDDCGKVTIKTSGRLQTQFLTPYPVPTVKNGRDGESGKDGLPGESAGNILIQANICERRECLEFEMNGSNGLPGQDGEQGHDGKDGEDGSHGDIDEYMSSISWRDSFNKLFAIKWACVAKGQQSSQCLGQTGGNGGSPGLGGEGGFGGSARVIVGEGEIISRNEQMKSRGKSGDPGKSGKGGKGGISGARGLDSGRQRHGFGKIEEKKEGVLAVSVSSGFFTYQELVTQQTKEQRRDIQAKSRKSKGRDGESKHSTAKQVLKKNEMMQLDKVIQKSVLERDCDAQCRDIQSQLAMLDKSDQQLMTQIGQIFEQKKGLDQVIQIRESQMKQVTETHQSVKARSVSLRTERSISRLAIGIPDLSSPKTPSSSTPLTPRGKRPTKSQSMWSGWRASGQALLSSVVGVAGRLRSKFNFTESEGAIEVFRAQEVLDVHREFVQEMADKMANKLKTFQEFSERGFPISLLHKIQSVFTETKTKWFEFKADEKRYHFLRFQVDIVLENIFDCCEWFLNETEDNRKIVTKFVENLIDLLQSFNWSIEIASQKLIALLRKNPKTLGYKANQIALNAYFSLQEFDCQSPEKLCLVFPIINNRIVLMMACDDTSDVIGLEIATSTLPKLLYYLDLSEGALKEKASETLFGDSTFAHALTSTPTLSLKKTLKNIDQFSFTLKDCDEFIAFLKKESLASQPEPQTIHLLLSYMISYLNKRYLQPLYRECQQQFSVNIESILSLFNRVNASGSEIESVYRSILAEIVTGNLTKKISTKELDEFVVGVLVTLDCKYFVSLGVKTEEIEAFNNSSLTERAKRLTVFLARLNPPCSDQLLSKIGLLLEHAVLEGAEFLDLDAQMERLYGNT
jgi:hypothetical protein